MTITVELRHVPPVPVRRREVVAGVRDGPHGRAIVGQPGVEVRHELLVVGGQPGVAGDDEEDSGGVGAQAGAGGQDAGGDAADADPGPGYDGGGGRHAGLDGAAIGSKGRLDPIHQSPLHLSKMF